MRGGAILLSAALLYACAGEITDEEGLVELDEAEAAAAAGCLRPNEVVIWGLRHLHELVDAIEAHASPCTTFFVSLPPVHDAAGNKTMPRGGAILAELQALRAAGVRVRVMAEFHWTSWRAWTMATGRTWYAAGREFRRRMDAAGYDAAAGDTWAVDEFPSSVRGGILGARAHARSAVRGMYDGGQVRRRGAVFITGVGVNMENFAEYRPALEDWVCDRPFWDDMDSYVRFFAQEVYADPHRVCVGSATVATRSRHVNDFAMHLARVAGEGPACAATARSYFNHAYTPLLSAAWQQRVGYGDTRITSRNMRRFVRLQTYAMRAWSATHQVPDGRIGFAWASSSEADPLAVDTLADALMSSIQGAYGPGGRAARACSPTGSYSGCDCEVSGAFFNDAWSRFPN